MAQRYFANTAMAASLTSSISASATSFDLADYSGFPNQFPFPAVIDRLGASMEVVEVTGATGSTVIVQRGIDGTTAKSHNAGSTFEHAASARDYAEANAHINSTSAHGITGQFVDTGSAQIADNKTLRNSTLLAQGANPALRAKGAGTAALVDINKADNSAAVDVDQDGNTSVAGTLTTGGAATIGGATSIAGALTATGAVTAEGQRVASFQGITRKANVSSETDTSETVLVTDLRRTWTQRADHRYMVVAVVPIEWTVISGDFASCKITLQAWNSGNPGGTEYGYDLIDKRAEFPFAEGDVAKIILFPAAVGSDTARDWAVALKTSANDRARIRSTGAIKDEADIAVIDLGI